MTSDTSSRPVSPLRTRMIEDMTVRGFSEQTRSHYVRHVRSFAAFIGRSPDAATAEDLRLFQLHQTQSGMQPLAAEAGTAPPGDVKSVFRSSGRPTRSFRPPRSARPVTARSGMGRRAGTAWRSSPAAPRRWRPAAACRAIPTIPTAATSKRRSAA